MGSVMPDWFRFSGEIPGNVVGLHYWFGGALQYDRLYKPFLSFEAALLPRRRDCGFCNQILSSKVIAASVTTLTCQ